MSETAPAAINVLLVDDSPFARNVGRLVLQSVGFASIREAASGQEAVDLIDRFGAEIDLVFCDLMMPDMDGIQMIRRVAMMANVPAFIFLSADAGLLNAAEDTARARGLSVRGTVPKPLTPDAIRRILATPGEASVARPGGSAVEYTAQDLDLALERDEFLLHFQPKVAVADGRVAGFEALVRWRRADGTIVFPGSFISVAEQTDRIGALSKRVTMLALNQCAIWRRSGMPTSLSINLSPIMLTDLELPDRMARKAKRLRINPRQLILEITESGLFRDTATALEILARLHMKGFPLSIDDFGTGYSSMEQLRRIPFAELKIDRIFVRGAGGSAKAQAILEASANLGRSLQMSVVAEGVETQEDWNVVRAAGIDLVQGYFVAKPMPAEDIPVWRIAWAAKILAMVPPIARREDVDDA